ncbi:MAG: hypothetical protein M0R05_03435 [Bacilli bacterium]|nr:hypothetical protein [Bacilli bacterium]MDD4076932.1 sporulation peptidase YabG [Bacilli bacterium]MDD4388083.1 sporulation peptidase YabG [Bacilli bacterium]
MGISLSDLVVIINDPHQIIYVVEKIEADKVYISGLHYRIRRIVTPQEITLATPQQIEAEKKQTDTYFQNLTSIRQKRNKNYLLGKILHIDGDKKYLDKCLELYNSVGIFSNGLTIKEDSISEKIKQLIYDLAPDVVVITGHDVYNQQGIKDLVNYSNSYNFIKAIKKIREIKSRTDLAIIAGACQSHFEALIAGGADFASSPKRINIHTFDPAVIAIKVATTSFSKIVSLSEALRYIDKGSDAFGGIETYGKMRLFL